MKYALRSCLLLVTLLASCAVVAQSQNQTSAQQSVESLRSQLADVEKKQEELQTRVRQLDEDLKPENIERYFALNGSTRPEELREQRRRQLENERANVQQQLDQLAASRTRLEASVAAAEAAAYRQSAYSGPTVQPTEVNPAPAASPKKSLRRARGTRTRRARRRG